MIFVGGRCGKRDYKCGAKYAGRLEKELEP